MLSLQDWAQLGDAVGGFATAGALLFAIIEITRRRRAALKEKRSLAAGHAAATLARTVAAIHHWYSQVLLSIDYVDPPENASRVRRDLITVDDAHWPSTQAAIQALFDVHAESYVHLDPEEHAGLADVGSYGEEMHQHLMDLIAAYPPIPSEDPLAPPRDTLAPLRSLRSTLEEGRRLLLARAEATAQVLTQIARLSR